MDRILIKNFYIVFQVSKVLFIKICKMQSLDLLFLLLFLLAFTWADIIFQKFLELHSALSAKKDFCYKFSCFNKFTQTPPSPHPLDSQNTQCIFWLLRGWGEGGVFYQCSLTYHGFLRFNTELILQSNFNPRFVVFI